MKGVSSKDDKAKPQNGIAETGSKNDIGAGTAQKMTYIFMLLLLVTIVSLKAILRLFSFVVNAGEKF